MSSNDPGTVSGTTTGMRLPETEVAASIAGQPPRGTTQRFADVPEREAASADLADALSRLAGVHARSRGNFAQEAQVSVRGHGARANFGLRGIRLLVDGVPASSADGQGQLGPFEPWLYDRVELIAGPAALLYGNASGGVLRVHRRAFEDWHGSVTVGEHQQSLFVAGPWLEPSSGNGDAQLALTAWQGDGARPHSHAQRASMVIHGTRAATPDVALNWQFSLSDAPETEDPLGLTLAQFELDPFAASPNALAFDTRKSSAQWQAALGASRSVLDTTDALTVWGGQRKIEQFLAVPPAAQANPRSGGGVIDLDRSFGGAEWTRSWKRDRLTVSFGLRAELQRDARRGYENFVDDRIGVRGALRRDELLRVESIDPLLSFEAMLRDDWSAFAGVRGTRLRFRVDDDYVASGNPDDSGSRRFSAWSPAAGIRWQRANWMFRASAGRGFESPTGNELAYRADGEGGLNQELRAARSRLHEVGAAQAGDRVSWSATAFDERIRDEIVVAQSSGGRSVFRNAGRTRRRGLELEADGEFGAEWRWSVTWTHLDARFLDGDTAGHRLPGVPRQWGAVRLSWLPGGRSGSTEWWANLHRASGVAVDDDNSLRTDSWTRLDGGVSHRFATRFGTARLGLSVHNLLDRTYVGSVIVNESNGRYLETALPRSAQVSFSLAWH